MDLWYNNHIANERGAVFMPKGVPKHKYTGDFKLKVVESLINDKLTYSEAVRRFDLGNHSVVMKWERIYIEEGPQALYIERRGRASSLTGSRRGRPPKLDKKVEEDLLAEVQRLRAENDLLKELAALISQRNRKKN